jgi:hypothetical protein
VATIGQIRQAVKDLLENTIDGVTVYRAMVEAASVPCVVIALAGDDTADFAVAMNKGTDRWHYDLHVMTANRDAEIGQDDLDPYIDGAGPKSIRAAVFANRTLGLANTDAWINGVSAYNASYESADLQHIGATLRLIVHTRGD